MSDLALPLRALDHRMSRINFRPRASLGPEVMGRWDRGEIPVSHGAPSLPLRTQLGLALLLLSLLTYGFCFARLGLSRSVDRCCQDLDGGGRLDDGVLVITRGGTAVRSLSIYEDRDGTRTFTAADAVRFAREGRPTVVGVAGDEVQTYQFCCLDYDGGGEADDGLMVVASPPDRIAMAGIYERRAHAPSQALR